MPLDEWQEQVLESAMGERANGRWVSKFIGLSAPRQNGKSQLIVARALAGVLLFSEKMIIISAHETDTAREVWKRLIDVVESNPSLEARVTGRMDAINREYLAFGKGVDRQTIKLKARRSSGSRGFSADCLLLDEAQILGKAAWGSIVPTMSARDNPQMWLFGTPPADEDDPYAFGRVRESAIAHKARHSWLEWSAAPGDDIDDPATWAKANPSFGVRVSHEACADDRSAMDDDQFSRERLGMWSIRSISQVFDMEAWQAMTDTTPRLTGPIVLALDRSVDGKAWALAAAQRTADGRIHIELSHHQGVTLRDVAAYVRAVVTSWNPAALVIDRKSAAMAVVPLLVADDIEPEETGAPQMAVACQGFLDDATDARLSHTGQKIFADSVGEVAKRTLPQGDFVWDRSGAVSPLVAATLARWGLLTYGVEQSHGTALPEVIHESNTRVDSIDMLSEAF